MKKIYIIYCYIKLRLTPVHMYSDRQLLEKKSICDICMSMRVMKIITR